MINLLPLYFMDEHDFCRLALPSPIAARGNEEAARRVHNYRKLTDQMGDLLILLTVPP